MLSENISVESISSAAVAPRIDAMATQTRIPFRSGARGFITAAICLTYYVPSWAAAPAARIQAALAVLANQFVVARSLPEGTRPTPPYFYLDQLVGASQSSVRQALGAPDPQWPISRDLCQAAICVSYTFGAQETISSPEPVRHNADGTNSIIVSTGGPWLLMLGFTDGRLVSARWLGQR